MDIRLDANEAWRAAELVDRVRPLLPFGPSALEQPVPHAEVDSLAELRPRLGIPVMLDESLCGYPDAVAAVERRTADLLNVRLSKCGGILPSLRIIALAQTIGPGRSAWLSPGRDVAALSRRAARRRARLGPAVRRGLVRPAYPQGERDDPGYHVRLWRPGSPARRAGARRRGRSSPHLNAMTVDQPRDLL